MFSIQITLGMSRHFIILLILLIAISFKVNVARAQSQTQNVLNYKTIGSHPDAKMIGGSSVGNALNHISASSLFTGSTTINIPFYKYKKSSGVSISYNTKGVKVDEVSSRIGLHWNLNYGGASIVRVVRDIPDEFRFDLDSFLYIEYSSTPTEEDSMMNKEMHVYGRVFAYNENAANLNAANAYEDRECDEFIVSLSGSNFKFYIGENLTVFTVPYKNLKVQLLADSIPISNISQLVGNGQNAPKLNFRITDNKGNAFYFYPYRSDLFSAFDKFEDCSLLWSNYVFANFSTLDLYTRQFPINWHLKKIVLSNGRQINYHYANVADVNILGGVQGYLNYYVKESTDVNQQPNPEFLGISKNKLEIPKTTIAQINYPNGVKVEFNYDSVKWNLAGEKLLKEINISAGDNCKRFIFYQDSVNTRFYLDSIVQMSCDYSKTEPYYSFAYYNLNGNNEPIFPKRLNSAQDLYGYYNGDSSGVIVDASGDNISIPKHNPSIGINYGNNRQYDGSFAKYGLLSSISNAYGKKVNYYYEENNISSIPIISLMPNNNHFIGTNQPDGVRLQSIFYTDKYHPLNTRLTVFDYYGGQIFMPGGYFHYPTYIDSLTNNWEEVIYQSYFLTPHQFVQGANHGYSKVEVRNYFEDQLSSKLLSKQVTTFTNMQDTLTGKNDTRYYKVPGSKDYFQYPYTNKQYLKGWEIGLPLTITNYDQNNKVVKKIINHYDFSTVDLSAASYIDNTKIAKVNSGTNFEFPWSLYKYYPYKKTFTDQYYPFRGIAKLDRSVTQKYISDNRFVSDTVWYTYDIHNNLKQTITQDSRGQKTSTRLVYNYDVDGPAYNNNSFFSSHPGTTLYNMSDAGLHIVVSTERWRLLPSLTLGSLLSAFITKYQFQDGKLWVKGLWNTQIGEPLSFNQYTGLPPYSAGNPYGKILDAYNSTEPISDYIKTSSVLIFDSIGNPLETQLLDQNQYKAMIWDTVSGHKLAESANCHYQDIAYTSFENTLEGSHFIISIGGYGPISNPLNSLVVHQNVNAITGARTLSLWTLTSPGTPVTIQGTSNLQSGKMYTLSFWLTPGSNQNPNIFPTIKIDNQLIPITSANVVYIKGNWKNYLIRFTPMTSGKISITGNAPLSQIDEVRIYPSNAKMQSWTYTPLFGKSSYTSPSGRITYYFYDKMGRQNLVKDQDGHILSKIDYHVAQ